MDLFEYCFESIYDINTLRQALQRLQRSVATDEDTREAVDRHGSAAVSNLVDTGGGADVDGKRTLAASDNVADELQ